MFGFFETFVPPYPEGAARPLPQGFFPFLWAGAWGARRYIASMTLLPAAIGVFEALLFGMLGKVVDWLAKVQPSRLWIDQRGHLLMLAAVLFEAAGEAVAGGLGDRHHRMLNTPGSGFGLRRVVGVGLDACQPLVQFPAQQFHVRLCTCRGGKSPEHRQAVPGSVGELSVRWGGALEIWGGTRDNAAVAEAVGGVAGEWKEGRGRGRPMMGTGRFPMLAVHMIQVGEETGRLDDMLMQVAETYDHEVEVAIRKALALLQPAIIVLMAGVIGFIIIAILSEMLSVYSFPI